MPLLIATLKICYLSRGKGSGRHGIRRWCPLEGNTPGCRAVTARAGRQSLSAAWPDLGDRAEQEQPFGFLAEENSGRGSDGAGRVLQGRSFFAWKDLLQAQ